MIDHVINVALEAAQLVFCKEADVLPHPELIAAHETGWTALSEDVRDLGEFPAASLDISPPLQETAARALHVMLRLSWGSRRWRLFACIRELQNACAIKLCGPRGFEVSLGPLNGRSFCTSAPVSPVSFGSIPSNGRLFQARLPIGAMLREMELIFRTLVPLEGPTVGSSVRGLAWQWSMSIADGLLGRDRRLACVDRGASSANLSGETPGLIYGCVLDATSSAMTSNRNASATP